MNGFTLPDWLAAIAGVLLIIGGLATLIGACGLVRFDGFYRRMHPATMGTTLGTGCVIVTSMLVSSALLERPVVHEILIAVFMVVSSPVSAITLMRAAISRTRS